MYVYGCMYVLVLVYDDFSLWNILMCVSILACVCSDTSKVKNWLGYMYVCMYVCMYVSLYVIGMAISTGQRAFSLRRWPWG